MGGIGVLRAEEDDGVLLFSPLVHSERKKISATDILGGVHGEQTAWEASRVPGTA